MHVTSRLRSGEATKHIGAIHHVTISDLTSIDPKPPRDVPVSPAIIVGKAESPIDSVALQNVSVVSAGGGTKPAKWTLPESRGHPHKAFAYAPAAALFVSDARGLTETMHLQHVNKLLLRDSAPLRDQSVDQINELAF